MNVKQNIFWRRAVYLSGFKNFASEVQFFQKRSFVGSSTRSVRGLVVGTLHHEPLLTLQAFAVNPVVRTKLVDAVTQDRLTSTAFSDGIGAVIENAACGQLRRQRQGI